MTWPSFRDGAQGAISKAWNVESWPTVYVIDRKGVIRYRNVRGQALDHAVSVRPHDQQVCSGSVSTPRTIRIVSLSKNSPRKVAAASQLSASLPIHCREASGKNSGFA